MKTKKKILIVSYDAGGANILSSLIKKYYKDFCWFVCAFGPAKKIFLKRRSLKISERSKIDELVAFIRSLKPDLLLTGTSWGSAVEVNFIKAARRIKVRTASFLDHWVNYKARFGETKNWRENLPDIVFVGDKWAYDIALKNGFPKDRLKQVENPYFEEVKKQIQIMKLNRKLKANKIIKILYLSQPIARYSLKGHADPNYLDQSEYRIVRDLLTIIERQKKVDPNYFLTLRIKLHPAEKENKYTSLLKNVKYDKIRKYLSVSRSWSNLFIKDCLWADIVVGSDSMALFVAQLIGKVVISYKPNNQFRESLPGGKIKRIFQFGDLSKAIYNCRRRKKFPKRAAYKNSVNNSFGKEFEKIISY